MGHATNFTYEVYSTLTPQLYNVFCDPESKLECGKLSHKRGYLKEAKVIIFASMTLTILVSLSFL